MVHPSDNTHNDLTATYLTGLTHTRSQALTGTTEADTYTFTLRDIGVTTFADGNNTTISFGFSSNGTDLDMGTSFTLTEGTDIFSPDTGSILASTSAASYTADGTEAPIKHEGDRNGPKNKPKVQGSFFAAIWVYFTT